MRKDIFTMFWIFYLTISYSICNCNSHCHSLLSFAVTKRNLIRIYSGRNGVWNWKQNPGSRSWSKGCRETLLSLFTGPCSVCCTIPPTMICLEMAPSITGMACTQQSLIKNMFWTCLRTVWWRNSLSLGYSSRITLASAKLMENQPGQPLFRDRVAIRKYCQRLDTIPIWVTMAD